jgi:hypothetical protein
VRYGSPLDRLRRNSVCSRAENSKKKRAIANGLGSEWNWPKVDGNRSVRGYGVLGGPKSRGPDREIENARKLQVVSGFSLAGRLASLYSNYLSNGALRVR